MSGARRHPRAAASAQNVNPAPVTSLAAVNQRFYDDLWSGARLVQAHRFNTWPTINALLPGAAARLEVAPGLRPRLPVGGTHFLDISLPALNELRAHGGKTVLGGITAMPFADASFDIVGAFDVVEHVDDDEAAFSELFRVASPRATLLLSVPLHPSAWTPFDEAVGHRRRYEPDRLAARLAQAGISIQRSAPFGIRPKGALAPSFGLRYMDRHPRRAMWWYNHVFMPMGLRLARPLRFGAGLVDVRAAAGVILECRKAGPRKSGRKP